MVATPGFGFTSTFRVLLEMYFVIIGLLHKLFMYHWATGKNYPLPLLLLSVITEAKRRKERILCSLWCAGTVTSHQGGPPSSIDLPILETFNYQPNLDKLTFEGINRFYLVPRLQLLAECRSDQCWRESEGWRLIYRDSRKLNNAGTSCPWLPFKTEIKCLSSQAWLHHVRGAVADQWMQVPLGPACGA